MVIFHRFLLVYQRVIPSARLERLGNVGYCSELMGPLFWQKRHETFDRSRIISVGLDYPRISSMKDGLYGYKPPMISREQHHNGYIGDG